MVAFISDFLIPIAPFALWIGVASLSVISLLTIYRLVSPGSKPSEDYDGIWYAPLAISTLLFSFICLSTYYISIQYKDINGSDSGFLSSNVEIIKVFQENTLFLKDIKEIQMKSLDEQIKTNETLENSQKIHLDSLNEQIKINEILNDSNKSLTSSLKQQKMINESLKMSNENLSLSLNEQKNINKSLKMSNENLSLSLNEQKNINKTLKESKNIQENISSNSNLNLKSTKNIELATYFSFTSLREALMSGDLETLSDFHDNGKSLTLVNQSSYEYSAPMIIEMIKQNKNNSEKVLEFLISKNAVDINKDFNVNVNAPIGYRSFWSLFMDRTKEIDSYIIRDISFEKMQKDFKRKYGYVFPDKLKEKYINTIPLGSKNYGSKSSKYSYSGGWLHGNALSIKVSLYSAALIANNEKVISFLEQKDAKNIGYYLMPSGVKILLDPAYLNLD